MLHLEEDAEEFDMNSYSRTLEYFLFRLVSTEIRLLMNVVLVVGGCSTLSVFRGLNSI